VAGRTPIQAGRNFISPIKTAVACVLRQPLSAYVPDGYEVGRSIGLSTFDLDPLPVSSKNGTLWIAIAISGQFIKDERQDRGPIRVTTTQHTLSISEDEEQAREILAYHWTPNAGNDQRTFPHLHIGRSILDAKYRSDPYNYQDMHIHTDRVSVEQFILTLIEEFGVKPTNARWHSVLRSSHGTFARYRSRL